MCYEAILDLTTCLQRMIRPILQLLRRRYYRGGEEASNQSGEMPIQHILIENVSPRHSDNPQHDGKKPVGHFFLG